MQVNDVVAATAPTRKASQSHFQSNSERPPTMNESEPKIQKWNRELLLGVYRNHWNATPRNSNGTINHAKRLKIGEPNTPQGPILDPKKTAHPAMCIRNTEAIIVATDFMKTERHSCGSGGKEARIQLRMLSPLATSGLFGFFLVNSRSWPIVVGGPKSLDE